MQPDPLDTQSTPEPTPEQAPEPAPEPIPEPAPEPVKESYPELRQIRTFQGDVASTIGRQKESLVSMQRREQERRKDQAPTTEELEAKDERKDSWKMVLLGLVTILLVGGGAVGGWYAYSEYQRKTELPVITKSPNRLIASASVTEIPLTELTRSNFLEKVVEVSEDTQAGQVTHIDIDQTTREFLATIKAQAPGRLLRAFGDIFMLGVLGGEEASIFLIVKLDSYESAFAGMLEWEANMAEELGPLFSTRLILRDAGSDTGFEDIVTRNKDTRALRMAVPVYTETATSTLESAATSTPVATATTTVLVYSFFDQDTLVITDSDESLFSILGRLANELLSR